MPPKLSTHVLDLTLGRPAAGMEIEFLRHGKETTLLKTISTNADGRTESPLLEGSDLLAGDYELVFHVRLYFAGRGVDCSFLDTVPIRFSVSEGVMNYHVPLLVTPWSYSTYRGS